MLQGHSQNLFQSISSTVMTGVTYECFAVAAPGLEPIVARELAARDVTRLHTISGGVTFHATTEQLYAANLWLRVASRVIVRLASFHASAFYELERHARRVAFERFIPPGVQVSVHVSCRKSRLYHSDAVAERIRRAVEHRTGAVVPPGDDGAMLIARLFHDQCTVSIDSSGALLHRRGYRLATAKAPLRETLAAAMLAATGWNGQAALVDPFCGSGTIPIEAALIARRRAPGIARSFAFMQWPEYDPARWASLAERARNGEAPAAGVPIVAADRDAGGTEAARANAERAGVSEDIEIRTQAISDLESPAAIGWLVTNPPWGVRVGESDKLRDLYARLGQVVRRRLPGWRLGLLAPKGVTVAARLPLTPIIQTVNGGIPVAVLSGTVTAAD
jgi:putative N6-adenine-specific DNA methylase